MSVAVDPATELALDEPRESGEVWPLWLMAACLVLPWVIIFTFVPAGVQNFPINDDWAFSKGLRDLLDGKRLLNDKPPDAIYQGWSSMPLLGQWLWALPWVAVLGLSHVTLRLSTIALSWLGLWAFYDLLRQYGTSRRAAAFTTVALAWTPYIMFLSATFMTDITSLSFSLIALALYNRAIQKGAGRVLLLATLVALFGAATRQNTIMAPAAAAVILVLNLERRREPLWWIALAVPVVVCVGLHLWCAHRSDTMPRTVELIQKDQAIRGPYYLLHFMGLFTLPVLLMVKARGSLLRLGLSMAVAVGAAIALGYYSYMPRVIVEGLLWPEGLKSVAWLHWLEKLPWFPYMDVWFPETFQMQGNGLAGLPAIFMYMPFRMGLSLLGIVGMAGLLPRLIDAAGNWRRPNILFVFTALQVLMLFLSPILYDRYFVPLLPGFFAIAAGACQTTSLRPWLGLPALFLAGLFSTSITHDMLETHSAIFRLGNRAVERGIRSDPKMKLRPQDIDGGMEWDGWYSSQPARWRYIKHLKYLRGINWGFNQINWDHLSGHYVISLAPPEEFWHRDVYIPGLTVDKEPFDLWAIPGRHHVYLLKYDPSVLPDIVPGREVLKHPKTSGSGK
jgi:hypothetical protein